MGLCSLLPRNQHTRHGSVVFCFASPATLTACRPLCRSCLRLSNQPSVAVSRSTGAMFVVMLVYPHICGNQYFSVPAAAALLYGWRRWPRLPWAGTGTLIQGLCGRGCVVQGLSTAAAVVCRRGQLSWCAGAAGIVAAERRSTVLDLTPQP